jgi:hypothetical protein
MQEGRGVAGDVHVGAPCVHGGDALGLPALTRHGQPGVERAALSRCAFTALACWTYYCVCDAHGVGAMVVGGASCV